MASGTILQVKDVPNYEGGVRRIVAVEGNIQDWAAYEGLNTMDPEYIAAHGDKLIRERAVKLFPILNPKHYRD